MSDANLVTIVDLVNSLDDYTLHLINNLKVRENRNDSISNMKMKLINSIYFAIFSFSVSVYAIEKIKTKLRAF